ncbi:hypothetical protein [Micromonospora andamanensis]|uniref:hypothetical protein n=1 Tax=Micromonospora andamanensis TaxID=1287068 RepID=UPI001951939F|nr:hypothetical protein [Micromonospora andamanensis]
MLEIVLIELSGRHPLLRSELSVSSVDGDQLVLDARRLRFAGPQELTAIVALASTDARRGREVVLRMPEDEDVASYLQRMDVIKLLRPIATIEGPLSSQSRVDCSTKLLEVTALTPANADRIAENLGEMSRTRLGTRTARTAFRGIAELIDNAVTHGAGPSGAFVAAQAYSGLTSKRPGLEFAVCDTGVGILAHLRQNPSNSSITDSETALRRALIAGVTGTDQPRGYGLGDLLDATRRGGVGRLVLRSGNAIASVVVRQDRIVSCRTVAIPIEGAWAWLRVRVP